MGRNNGDEVSSQMQSGEGEERSPLRIALVVYRGNPYSGGQGVYTKYLARELTKLGHQVEVFSGPPYPDLDDGIKLHKLASLDLFRQPDPFRIPRISEFKSLIDVLEFAIMCTGGFGEPKTFGLRLYRALRDRKDDFDILHDNQSLSWSILRLYRQGMAVVASIHHPITVDRRLGLRQASGWKERFGLWRFYGFLSMQAKVARSLPDLLTVSEASLRDIVREMNVPSSSLSVIPVGVDTTVFRPKPHICREEDLLVTTASADVALKGLRYLVEAVIQCHESGLCAPRLMIIGSPKKDSEVQRIVTSAGMGEVIQFVGTLGQEELVETYARAAVAIVPSLYEGFSLPAIEAMAMGTPLIATDGGALAEVVGRDGDVARVVGAGDASALAQVISEVLGDPESAKVRAKAAQEMVTERFTWAAAAQQTQELYYRILRAPSRGSGRPKGRVDGVSR